MLQPELLDIFISKLEKSGFDYMITGSIASIFYGEPRLTHDIDIIIDIQEKDIDRFYTLFPSSEYYCPPPDILRIELSRRAFSHFNLVHHESGLKADCYTARSDSLHLHAMKKRKRIKINEELSIWLAPPEYVIIRKMQYYRDGGGRKHIDDILNMLNVSADILDVKELEELIATYDVQKIWEMIQEQL